MGSYNSISLIDSNGVIYDSILSFCQKNGIPKSTVSENINKKGYYENKNTGISVRKIGGIGKIEKTDDDISEEIKNYKSARSSEFNYYKIKNVKDYDSSRYAIALFSDAHVEETVQSESILGLNEYNTDIAKDRISRYFANLVSCLKKDIVDTLYFASLGDTISGFIHEHLQQENGMTPPQSVLFAQSLIVSGLKFIREQLPYLNIIFIGISGNHSRLTKKVQSSNGFKLSYEWIMYQNIKQICETLNLNISFIIPESELALVETPDGKRYIFCHGFQVQSKGTGTVAGIYPALGRLAMKWQKIFNQDKIFLGHYHTNISIPLATVNGSIIGYNAFALSNGMSYEEPSQQYEVYDSERGLLLSRKIYCKWGNNIK